MNKSKIADKIQELLPPHDTSINAVLLLPSGKEYELLTFETEFQQAFDYRGEPEEEVKGGLLTLTMNHAATEELNAWMFGNNVAYSGLIRFAPFSRFASPPLIISFEKGYCIQYQKTIGELGGGITLRLVISAKKISVDEITHKNDPQY